MIRSSGCRLWSPDHPRARAEDRCSYTTPRDTTTTPLPQARRIAFETEVAWGEGSGLVKALGMLRARLSRPPRVGAMGLLSLRQHKILSEATARVADLNPHYARLRLRKSA